MREFLHLPEEIVPATLKKKPQAFGDRPERGDRYLLDIIYFLFILFIPVDHSVIVKEETDQDSEAKEDQDLSDKRKPDQKETLNQPLDQLEWEEEELDNINHLSSRFIELECE